MQSGSTIMLSRLKLPANISRFSYMAPLQEQPLSDRRWQLVAALSGRIVAAAKANAPDSVSQRAAGHVAPPASGLGPAVSFVP